METVGTDIFHLAAFSHEEGKITASLSVNINSPIFEGHFPAQPVVPGACILQMVKDLMEKVSVRPLRLKKAVNLKFISMITPEINDVSAEVSYKIIKDEISAIASLSAGGKVCFKLQGVFVEKF